MKQNDYEWLLRDPIYAKHLEDENIKMKDYIENVVSACYDCLPYCFIEEGEELLKCKVTKSVT